MAELSEIQMLEASLKEKELQIQELKKFEALFYGINDLAYICDTEGIILFVNQRLTKYSGHKPEEFSGKPFAPLFDEENLKKAIEVYTRTLKGESPEYELYFKDTGVLCEYKNVPFRNEKGAITGVVGIARDISEKRAAEEVLRAERDKAQKYLDVAGVIFLVIDENQSVTLINRKGAEVLGYNGEEEVLGKNWFDCFLPETEREAIRSKFSEFFAEGLDHEPMFYCENSVLTRDGSEKLIAWHNTVLRDSSGKVYATLSSGTDITDVRKAEGELKKYRANIEAIFRSVRDSIITVDKQFHIIELNDAAKSICSLTRDDIGRQFNPPDCAKRCLDPLIETFKKKMPVEVARFDCHKTSGHTQFVGINSYPLIDGNGSFSGAVMVVRDETRLADLERDLKERKQLHNIIGSSSGMQEIFSLIEDLADFQTTVLLTGETGTGKELVAEALHYTGLRSDRALVKVNCSAISEHLLESELFGHVKGAFTGAVRDRIGRFQLADSGTIFLDEIGDLSQDMQLKLLRVLQHREFERVGDSRTVKVDVRIIAATNKVLTNRVKAGKFREDLYYRLKVVEINVPALRERLEDLPLLTEYFLAKFNKKYKKEITSISSDVENAFMAYSWPGNIRELEHAIEHAFILCRGEKIELNHLPQLFHSMPKHIYNKDDQANEHAAILGALEKTDWNKSKAARLLGMSRRTIYRKMETYKIQKRRD
ncbi:MAG: sigma 54-interacting transcriptional regulator [Deltaproteobacteria bacterium]|nr:sigma 54-interacting transcriptional regulator [Deltaproteobacteria bacterium]